MGGLTKLVRPLMMYRLRPTPRRLAKLLGHLGLTEDDAWAPYLGEAFRLYKLQLKVPALATPAELAGSRGRRS